MSIPDSAIERRDGFRVDLSAYRADMRTTGRIFADRELFKAIRADETLEQVANVATLPGIVGQAMASPSGAWPPRMPRPEAAVSSRPEGWASTSTAV
jgi:tRNA-splicing ligase RtcB